jgi:signal transduction histidine kinase/CheY-like chemotaxis protein
MAIDPQVLRAEQHIEVGQIIQRDAGLLIDRWSRRAVAEQPHGPRMHHRALLDDLPRLLEAVGQCLADNDPHAVPHCVPAAEHGVQRWENGWSLPEVVRDYQILRLVIWEYLEETLERPIHVREMMAVGLALDEAISASVGAYVRHRDEHVRRVEESLRQQATALRESDRRKNEFLGMLAHELRNPLAPILNSVEVLRMLQPADAPDRPSGLSPAATTMSVTRARDIIERQVRQMVRLVDDLLDLTRIAAGKIQLRRTTFDLAEAVAQAIQTTAPLYESQQHQLAVHLPTEPLRLEADEARVVQVLVNLLTNAAKYTDRGGQIILTGSREDGEAVLRVRDNGIGIEPTLLPRIFDLFMQTDRALDRSQGGLGIGLSLVRSLVELHGGRVEAFSDGPSMGSEFVVRLPAAPAGESAAGQAGAGTPRPTGRHILVVEDHADARSTLQMLLELLGHRVETAGNGVEAIERARTARPQVALIDLGLPGMDGFQVAQRLRAELGKGVRLIALTGHALEADRQRSQAVGFDAHLVKPVDHDELTRALEPPAN